MKFIELLTCKEPWRNKDSEITKILTDKQILEQMALPLINRS